MNNYYTTNANVTEEMVANAELATVTEDYKVGLDNRPVNAIKFNENGWFEFQATAHVIINEVAYNCYYSKFTNKLYKVAC